MSSFIFNGYSLHPINFSDFTSLIRGTLLEHASILGSAESKELYQLIGPSELHGLEVPLEISEGLEPFFRLWFPRYLKLPQDAGGFLRNGLYQLRPQTAFEFGHLLFSDLEQSNWGRMRDLLTDDEGEALCSEPLGEFFLDTLPEIMAAATSELRRRYPSGDGVLFLRPHFIELLSEP